MVSCAKKDQLLRNKMFLWGRSGCSLMSCSLQVQHQVGKIALILDSNTSLPLRTASEAVVKKTGATRKRECKVRAKNTQKRFICRGHRVSSTVKHMFISAIFLSLFLSGIEYVLVRPIKNRLMVITLLPHYQPTFIFLFILFHCIEYMFYRNAPD